MGAFRGKCAISHLAQAKWGSLLVQYSTECSLNTLDGVCQSLGKMGATTGMSRHEKCPTDCMSLYFCLTHV